MAQFILGFVWYSGMTPIGRRWASEVGVPQEGESGMAMLIFPVTSIMAAWAAAMVYGWSGAQGPMQGVYAAWVVAFAVAAQALSTGVATGKNTVALHAINVGYLAVGYALMGAIIGLLS